jgi:hypothetical protein
MMILVIDDDNNVNDNNKHHQQLHFYQLLLVCSQRYFVRRMVSHCSWQHPTKMKTKKNVEKIRVEVKHNRNRTKHGSRNRDTDDVLKDVLKGRQRDPIVVNWQVIKVTGSYTVIFDIIPEITDHGTHQK